MARIERIAVAVAVFTALGAPTRALAQSECGLTSYPAKPTDRVGSRSRPRDAGSSLAQTMEKPYTF